MQVVCSYEFQSNSVVFATASSATRLPILHIDTWAGYLLSSGVADPMLCAIFPGQKTVMFCSWVATLVQVQQHISKILRGLPSSNCNSKLVSDVSIDQLGTSWDLGELTLSLLLEFT